MKSLRQLLPDIIGRNGSSSVLPETQKKSEIWWFNSSQSLYKWLRTILCIILHVLLHATKHNQVHGIHESEAKTQQWAIGMAGNYRGNITKYSHSCKNDCNAFCIFRSPAKRTISFVQTDLYRLHVVVTCEVHAIQHNHVDRKSVV